MLAIAVPMAVIVALAAVVMAYVTLVRLGRDVRPTGELSTALARAADRVRPRTGRREQPRTPTRAG